MDYLFGKWNTFRGSLRDRHVFLFLDYDGTLTPIAKRPEEAQISSKTRGLLKRLAAVPRCRIAIISGRSLKDIRSKVGVRNIIYAGNHGSEMQGPKIRFKSPVSLRHRNALKRLKIDLIKNLSLIKGVIVEDKGLSLSVHYRLVDKRQIPRLKAIVHETIGAHSDRDKMRINTGKMVVEIRPCEGWDKGKVVLWLLAKQQSILKSKDVFPVYIGDDVTDEDAFRALKKKGCTVFVGKHKISDARYYVKNAGEVAEFLERLSDYFRERILVVNTEPAG